MATYTKIKSGWRCQVRKAGISKSQNFKTKAAAQMWAMQLETEIANGTFTDVPDIPFSAVIDRYIKEITPTKKGSRSEKSRLNMFKEMDIGKKSLIDLCEDDFNQLIEQRLKTVQSSSVLREFNILSNVITYAMKWKYINKNPIKLIDRPERGQDRTRRYTDEEIERIVYVSKYDFNYLPTTSRARTGAAMLFAIETAMRAGEICKTTWENINFEKRTLFIPDSKNSHSRTVPLSSVAMKIINHLFLVKSNYDSRVFRMSSDTLDKNFRTLKELAALDDADLHFHDTRREALSRLAKKVDVMTLAKISGHRDIKILLNTYYAPNIEEVVDLLD
ncbi:tyrosine-type recombinase/integrase [Pasteurella multocida]|uniref:tyrosine-type recombinase/integrase n=1 Tax=Pasteurella multocida TaxID=747 RepID=UPI00402B110A